jgi:hypothetical protein
MTQLDDVAVTRFDNGGLFQSQALTGDALISIKNGVVTLNKGSAIAATIALPTATTDDFKILTITSLTAQAHTLAPTSGSFGNGGSNFVKATYGGAVGDGISLMAYQGQWYVIGQKGITLSS